MAVREQLDRVRSVRFCGSFRGLISSESNAINIQTAYSG